jgi:surfactin synthase thioesterase subunit
VTTLGLPEELPREPVGAILVVPHAGNGAAMANPLRAASPDNWIVGGVMFGGREARFADEPPSSLRELVADVAGAAVELAELAGRPPVLVGQCSGALLAWLAAASLIQDGRQVPGVVVVSRVAPSVPGDIPDATAPPEVFVTQLRQLGGVPAEVADMPELLELLLPALRADFACLAQWDPRQAGRVPPLTIPALAIYSETDASCPEPEVTAWRKQFPDVRIVATAGGHFLINEAPAQIAAQLASWQPLSDLT